jgi:molybdopterin-guanine dinucleotide biosynthesis protein A
MGTDKAFLEFGQNQFIYRIARELLRVSDDLVVVIGRKDKSHFQQIFDELKLEGHDPSQVRLLNDNYTFENPLSGILTGFESAKHEVAVVVACDMPLISSNVLKSLRRQIEGFDCVVPIWEDYNIEPLCGVYNIKNSIEAAKLAIEDGKVGPKHMVSYIQKVNYVPVSSLRLLDPNLESLMNINYPREYEELVLSLSRQREIATDQVSLEVRNEISEGTGHA